MAGHRSNRYTILYLVIVFFIKTGHSSSQREELQTIIQILHSFPEAKKRTAISDVLSQISRSSDPKIEDLIFLTDNTGKNLIFWAAKDFPKLLHQLLMLHDQIISRNQEKIISIIKDKETKDLMDLLKKMPPESRSNFSLVYSPLGNKGRDVSLEAIDLRSPESPNLDELDFRNLRVILGDPSSLIHLSFDDNDRNTVDLSLFDPSDPIMPRKFFDVDLQQSPSNRLGTISPQSCMNCHRPAGNDLPKKPRGSGRLNVEPFYVWDQWQGSLNDGFHNDQQHLPDDFVRRDREFTRIFTEAYNNGSLSETVYGQLPALPTRIAADLDRFSNRDSRNPRANLESLRLISRLNARKIATELINSPNYQSLKNIVLYILKCPNHLSEEIKIDMSHFDQLLEFVSKLNGKEENMKLPTGIDEYEKELFHGLLTIDSVLGTDFTDSKTIGLNWSNRFRPQAPLKGVSAFSNGDTTTLDLIPYFLQALDSDWSLLSSPINCVDLTRNSIVEIENYLSENIIARVKARNFIYEMRRAGDSSNDEIEAPTAQLPPMNIFQNQCIKCHDEDSRYPITAENLHSPPSSPKSTEETIFDESLLRVSDENHAFPMPKEERALTAEEKNELESEFNRQLN